MLAEDSTEAESVVPGESHEAPDAGQVIARGCVQKLPVCIQTEEVRSQQKQVLYMHICHCVKELENYATLEEMDEEPGQSQSVPGDQLLPHPSETHRSPEETDHHVIVIVSDTDSEGDHEEESEEEEEEEQVCCCTTA